MEIRVAKTAGFCFGVKRAVDLTYGLLNEGCKVATLGPLIHNPQAVEDMHKFQDEQTGMFWQVIDHPEAEGNYLETSGTALFAYAVLKGVRLGYLPKRMAAWAEKAFYGTCDRYLSKNPDGSLQLDGICLVAGLGGKDHRDGSLAYYFSEPVVCNDAKGVGPLVLAYTEMIARK